MMPSEQTVELYHLMQAQRVDISIENDRLRIDGVKKLSPSHITILKEKKDEFIHLIEKQAKESQQEPILDESEGKEQNEEARKLGLLIGISGQVYTRQLNHSTHLYIEDMDDKYICYWHKYKDEKVIKEKFIAAGSWDLVIFKVKKEIAWWDSIR